MSSPDYEGRLQLRDNSHNSTSSNDGSSDYRRSGEFANAVGTHCILAIGASTGIKSIEETLAFMKTHTAG